MRIKWKHLFESDEEIRRLERAHREDPADRELAARYKRAKNRAKDKRYLPFELTLGEQRGMRFIQARYVSAEQLWDGWDPETNTIPIGYVVAAYIGTGGDGGMVRTVPLAGGSLNRKIQSLFDDVEARSNDLEIFDIAIEFGNDESNYTPQKLRRMVPARFRFFG